MEVSGKQEKTTFNRTSRRRETARTTKDMPLDKEASVAALDEEQDENEVKVLSTDARVEERDSNHRRTPG